MAQVCDATGDATRIKAGNQKYIITYATYLLNFGYQCFGMSGSVVGGGSFNATAGKSFV